MNIKFLAAAALAIAFIPGIANADQVYGSSESNGSPFIDFLTRLIVPGADKDRAAEQSVAYADNPELIGHRRGSTNAFMRK